MLPAKNQNYIPFIYITHILLFIIFFQKRVLTVLRRMKIHT